MPPTHVPIRVNKEHEKREDREGLEGRTNEAPPAPQPQDTADNSQGSESDLEMWRDRALRLQAEMENYRRRQQRAAEARVLEERERLLLAFLDVVDNLERALAAADTATDAGADGLKEGVRVTREAALRFLNQMGVEPVAAAGRAFDPDWHEAIGTSPGCAAVEPGTIATVLRPGYRLNDRLLRPARVIVAA